MAHVPDQAHNTTEFKATSQNVMHASGVTTDPVYGKLIANDVQDIIGNLGKDKYIALTDQLAELLKLIRANS